MPYQPKPRDLTPKGEIYDHIIINDTRQRRWRQIAILEPGQTVLFRYIDFPDLANLFHSVRVAAHHYRKKCNFIIKVSKTKEGIFVHRPFDDDNKVSSSSLQTTIELRDIEWREWWNRVAREAGLRQNWFEINMPPPDRRER